MKRVAGWLVLVSVVLSSPGLAEAQPKRVLWWDDPLIVEQIGLSDQQRAKMSQAFAAYEQRSGPSRRNSVTQKPYLTALEAGDWKTARAEVDRWLESDQVPKRAMAELKLAVLPILSSEQRAALKQHYPRLIRRPWNPSPHWAGRPGQADRRLRDKRPKREREPVREGAAGAGKP